MSVRKWKVWEHMRDYFPVKVSFGQISLDLFTFASNTQMLTVYRTANIFKNLKPYEMSN